MIPNMDPRLIAIFTDRVAPVVAFDENGCALVLDLGTGWLRPVSSHPGFQRLQINPWNPAA